jgi:L-aspartate oxidase
MERYFDFLVVGSGVAGLSFAIKVAERGTVCIISKTKLEETNTSYAQGGIAAVTYAPDSYAKHIEDTMIAGDGICNREIVEMVVREAPERIQELVQWGANFDKKEDGKFDLNREGGHSESRVLHHKDNTGFEIQRALTQRVLNHPKITSMDYHFAVELITQHHLGQEVNRRTNGIECYGAYVFNMRTNSVDTIHSKVTYIATGGSGNVYQTTTNPVISTGDGAAMVFRAKGVVENMEFVQFHPTSLYNPGERPSFLITEALRGFGAVLKTREGLEFMHRYDKRESLAPRDIVARAIDSEMKASGSDYVYLDCRHLNQERLTSHFPNIVEKCNLLGIYLDRDMIPVVPAAHYFCGGIKTDAHGLTSIQRLYAGGECASTGLHGANRLASNSLLEAVVFSHRSAVSAIELMQRTPFKNGIPDWNDSGTSNPEEMVLITQNMKELQQIMSYYVGIVRSNLRLKRAFDRTALIFKETEDLYKRSTVSQQLCELRNSITLAYLVITQAMARKESRGLHFSIDYKKKHREFD